MRPRHALWLFGAAVVLAGATVTYVRCPGCIPRERINAGCEWTGDTRFALDLQNPAHRAHLVEDAQLAEELGIRYADLEHGRRTGIEHHGGLLDNGRVRNECLSRMFAAIEDHHGVTADQVRVARGRRSPAFDVAVAFLFVPFYSLVVAVVCRGLYRRFSPEDGHARWIASGLASVALAVLGAQCLRLWGAVWEVIRVGNGHMTSIRAASQTVWIKQHPGADIVAGVLLFWLIALIRFRMAPGDEPGNDNTLPPAILLR
jgi:hypothetical protein